jgi:hypothetical protein
VKRASNKTKLKISNVSRGPRELVLTNIARMNTAMSFGTEIGEEGSGSEHPEQHANEHCDTEAATHASDAGTLRSGLSILLTPFAFVTPLVLITAR